jgi:hypothetical protein
VRHERVEGRDREVEDEPAVRGQAAKEAEPEATPADGDDVDGTTTRRGSSSERSER